MFKKLLNNYSIRPNLFKKGLDTKTTKTFGFSWKIYDYSTLDETEGFV